MRYGGSTMIGGRGHRMFPGVGASDHSQRRSGQLSSQPVPSPPKPMRRRPPTCRTLVGATSRPTAGSSSSVTSPHPPWIGRPIPRPLPSPGDSLGQRSSIGRTGVCWDNAMAEPSFSAAKNERVYCTVYADCGTPARNTSEDGQFAQRAGGCAGQAARANGGQRSSPQGPLPAYRPAHPSHPATLRPWGT
jgi:hypothetical protein